MQFYLATTISITIDCSPPKSMTNQSPISLYSIVPSSRGARAEHATGVAPNPGCKLYVLHMFQMQLQSVGARYSSTKIQNQEMAVYFDGGYLPGL